jgi:hypothetical protein
MKEVKLHLVSAFSQTYWDDRGRRTINGLFFMKKMFFFFQKNVYTFHRSSSQKLTNTLKNVFDSFLTPY